MEPEEVAAYLARIGADRQAQPSPEWLAQLQLRHLQTVPFENLSIHLGEPIVLEEAMLVDKVVHRRRGGFCYELNGAFAALLDALGFPVTRLAARVFGDEGRLGPPFDHMALRVDLGETWLVDVGFGRHSHLPLRMDTGDEQADPGGVFRVVPSDEGDVDVLMNGGPQYRLEQRARALADYEATSWWQQTSPKSNFRQSLVCTRLTETGRVTLSDRLLIVTDKDARTESILASDAEVLSAYAQHFGVVLDRVPHIPLAAITTP